MVGGMDATRTRLNTVESYDPREGRWAAVPPMQRARASCGLAVLASQMFVVAGVLAPPQYPRAYCEVQTTMASESSSSCMSAAPRRMVGLSIWVRSAPCTGLSSHDIRHRDTHFDVWFHMMTGYFAARQGILPLSA